METNTAAKYFVAWKLDDNGNWVNEQRAASLDEARQLLAHEGCAGAGQLTGGKIFFGESWKRGLSSVKGEISISCRNEDRLADLYRVAAQPLPTPSAEAAAEYEAIRGKVSRPPTTEELAAEDERDGQAMQDAAWREKEAQARNYPA